MASEWQRLRLDNLKAEGEGSIAIGPFGSRMKADRYTPTGVPVIRGTNLSDTRAFGGEFVYVSPETADELRNCNVHAGDLVFPHRGAIGEVGIVPQNGAERYVLSTSLMKFTCNRELVDPVFLFYFFRSPVGRHELLKNASTVGTPGIGQPLTSLKSIEVLLPSLSEQQRIAAILGAFDDKIELNRGMNETLEGMARALFESWFMDFDPVHTKREARDDGLAKPIADLFPNSFEDSEFGEIPRGWHVATVDEDFDLTMGQSPPGETYNEIGNGTPFFQGRADFGFRFPRKRVYCTAPTRFAQAGDTLVSVRAPVGDINMAAEKCCVGRGVAAVRHKSGSRSYTYYYMRSLRQVFDKFEAEGTVFGSISKKDFHAITRIAPPDSLVAEFERMLYPLDESIKVRTHEIETLTKLRGALLPKLISGELRLTDID